MTVSEKLSIDTPEQINLEYELAGLGSRFMALFVDTMIQAVAVVVLGIMLLIMGVLFSIPFKSGGTWAMAIMVALVFGAQWCYFTVFEIVWKGQTPGKRQAGIRVINESGRQASVYEAVARNLLRAIDSLPGVYAVGTMVMFLSPQSKRLGDYVAGTVVVHDREPEESSVFFNTTKEQLLENVDYSALNATDIQVIETFLNRRLDLPLDVRRETALRLARHFREKCNIPDETRMDTENLLEMLVRGFRHGARFYGK